MVRKLKNNIKKVSEIKSKLEEELDLDFMFEENEGETFDRFEKFDVNIPLKSVSYLRLQLDIPIQKI